VQEFVIAAIGCDVGEQLFNFENCAHPNAP
jgi:hypothetical protein